MASSKNTYIIRFAIIYFLIAIGFGLVVRKIIQIQHPERQRWLALSDSLRRVNRELEIEPTRGNIYSDEGLLMASTVPDYFLSIDFQTPALRDKGGKLFRDNLDSLAICLSIKFKDKTPTEYRNYLMQGYLSKQRNFPLNKIKISHVDYKEIKQFPLFRLGIRSGLIAKKRVKRIKPYGSLAAITIGDLFGEKNKGAKYGIEAAYDQYLRGKPGKAHFERKAGANILVPNQEPENGADIMSTINVEMQDIAEKALRERLATLNADLGCVVLMETKTGQVKACVNLKREDEGVYRETESIVLRYKLEPGSTFKIPAMMAALEDGLVKPTDTVDCGKGKWQFNEKVLITDHNTGEMSNGKITAADAIIRSSNVGMSKLIYRAYKNDPQRYVNTLRRMGVGMPMDVGFPGAVKASIRGPHENPLWAPSDLASMAFGYSVNMPLLYTLAFYNAIANNGEMVAPCFVKKIVRNGQVVKEFEPKVLKASICSKQTLATIKDMMLQVVEAPEHSTGKAVKSPYVRIAGKTGTARYNYTGKESDDSQYKYQVSFCGFYPYENPEYTCIVFIRNPVGVPSGGNMSGPVFREIAERIMAKRSFVTIDKFQFDSLRTRQPAIATGNINALAVVLKGLKFRFDDSKFPNWVSAQADTTNTVRFQPYHYQAKTVPSVIGMGLKDALFLVERMGLRATVTGRGRVCAQSLQAGLPLKKGQVINLTLK